jgi:glycerate kinase
MHILIAPNAFKNSLSAGDAAMAIQEGFRRSRLDCSTECFPVGDGGDGTVDLIIKRLGGTTIQAEARDPLGRSFATYFGLIGGEGLTDSGGTIDGKGTVGGGGETIGGKATIDERRTAVIEMANASGLRLLKDKELDPLHALSSGTGDLIRKALDKGVGRIIIGMGGSATVDGGVGILHALGIRFLDAAGKDLEGLPGSLADLARIDDSGLDPRIRTAELIVLCDVDNKLLGEQGAAAVFGPQKGASPPAVKKLDAALAKFSQIALRQKGEDMSALKYGGTAGGAAAGLHLFLGARLVNGIEHFLDLTDFEKALQRSALVITGEGSIDEQTLQGKGPFGVAVRAKAHGLPVIGLAGRLPLENNALLQEYFDVLLAIGNEPSGLAAALPATASNLQRTAQEIGNLLAIYSRPPSQPA